MLNDHTARLEASQEPHAPVSLPKNESMRWASRRLLTNFSR
jgi:hypothetical protein